MSEIVKAILATAKKVGTLGKGAMNSHGGYAYVSIDRFYEVVARTANDNGLNWVLRETQFEVLPNVGKMGAIRVNYAVDLMHESGETQRDFSQVSIIHPIQGAQTVGSSMSYCDKVVMRQLFKVPTGEKDIDADETYNRALDIAPEPKRMKPPAPADLILEKDDIILDAPEVHLPGEEDAPGWKQLEDGLTLAIDSARDQDELKEAWALNVPALEHAKRHDEAMHKRIVAKFTARKNALKGK